MQWLARRRSKARPVFSPALFDFVPPLALARTRLGKALPGPRAPIAVHAALSREGTAVAHSSTGLESPAAAEHAAETCGQGCSRGRSSEHHVGVSVYAITRKAADERIVRPLHAVHVRTWRSRHAADGMPASADALLLLLLLS